MNVLTRGEREAKCRHCLTTTNVCDGFLNFENNLNKRESLIPRIHDLIADVSVNHNIYFDFIMKQITREARGMFAADEFISLLCHSLTNIEEFCLKSPLLNEGEIIAEIFYVLEVVDKIAQNRLLPDEYNTFKDQAKIETRLFITKIFTPGLTPFDWNRILGKKEKTVTTEQCIATVASLLLLSIIALK